MRKKDLTKKVISELNRFKFASICTGSLSFNICPIFFPFPNMMPKIKAEIAPLPPRNSEKAYKRKVVKRVTI